MDAACCNPCTVKDIERRDTAGYIPKPGKQRCALLGCPLLRTGHSNAVPLKCYRHLWQTFCPAPSATYLRRVPTKPLATLHERIAGGKIEWVLEADLKNFFGA